MSCNIDRASNSKELLTLLCEIDITVPKRTNQRKTRHTETWIISRLLSTLAPTAYLRFPVAVIHRDRPDIFIRMNGDTVGVEISEAITPQFAKYCALAEREFPCTLLEPAHFKWGAPHLTTDQMRDLLRQSSLSSDGWVGNAPEREWACFIQSLVNKKLDKLGSTGFSVVDQNWLAVYDNLALPANVNVGIATNYLQSLLKAHWRLTPHFNKIFIEHGDVIVIISETGVEKFSINNLWKHRHNPSGDF